MSASFASTLSEFVSAGLSEREQRLFNNVPVPAYIRWTSSEGDVAAAAAWVQKHQPQLEQTLQMHGAVVFRNFPLRTAEDFNAFICAFQGYEDLPYEQSLSFAVRLPVVGRVCTTNEGKTGGQVFHHEQAQTPAWPSRLFFFCQQPAEQGGGTAVCPSDVVLEQLAAKHPAFVKDLEAKGVKYTATMQAENDASMGVGRSWKSFFGRQTRADVEARMTELGYTWQWLENEVLRCTSPVLQAIRTAPGTNRRVFFNQLPATIANATDFHNRMADKGSVGLDEVVARYITFGDGSAMDFKILMEAKDLCEANAVEIEWQQGDVALLDNYLVMHARRPFEGPRKVLASLVK